MNKITIIGLTSGLLVVGGLAVFLTKVGKNNESFLSKVQTGVAPQKQESKKSIVDQIYPTPYGGEKGKITLKNLDLNRIPGEQELRRAGQLGSPLTPTRSAEPQDIKDPAQRKLQEQDNLLFAKAMDLWNRHNYKDAVQIFQKHRAQFPDSPWAGEAELHMGCEAQFNGRWDEAEFNFEWILKQAEKGSDIFQKAKLRRSVLAMEQGQIQLAIDSFKEMLKTEKSWERRTYAQTWIRQLSLWKNFQAALRNCGSESIAYLCDIRGEAEKAEKLRQRPAKGDHGFTMEELMAVAKEVGFKPKAIRADSQELDKITTPFIAHYRDLHYVVVKEISFQTKEVKIYDPRLKHEAKLPRDNFLNQWSGLGIVFNKQISKEIRLASVEDLRQIGGCCGIPRPEDDLGDNLPPKNPCGQGLPTWGVNRINFNVVVRDIPLWYDNEIGPNVEILLTYNSQDAINQLRPFGNKWSFNYASYAMEGPGGKVTIVMPNGRRDEYTPNGLNHYKPPTDRPDYQLTKTGDYAYELKLPDGEVYRYAVPASMEGESTTSLLVEVRDVFGQKVTLEHNAEGSLTKIKDALNRETLIYYNPQGYISHINDPFGRQASFDYNQNNDLILQSDMGGVVYGYSYGAESYLASITLPSGETKFKIEPPPGIGIVGDTNYAALAQNDYQEIQNNDAATEEEDYRITITDPLGFKEEYFYHSHPQKAHGWYLNKKQYLWNAPGSPRTRYFYTLVEGKGVISGIQYADDSKEFFSNYTSHKKPQTIKDPNENTQKFTYNSKAKILTHTDARGNPTTFTYAENNKQDLTKVVNALNQTVLELTYAAEGQIASVKDANNHLTSYDYNEFGNLTSVTDALGEVTTYLRNELQQVIEIKKAGATLVTFTYDPIGRIKTVIDSLGNTKTYEYNNLNRVTKIIYSDGTTVENQWDCCRLENQTDRAGNTTHFSYDAVGKLLTKTDAQNRITKFFYDPNGNLIKLVDPKGNQTQWEYDVMDRMVKRIYADNSELKYDYDKVANLIKFTNARNQTINLAYDKTYNFTGFSGANLSPVSFGYDKLNRQTQIIDNLGTTLYDYDAASRLKSIDGPWDNDTITYTYDKLNRVTQRTIGSTNVSLLYDELGRIAFQTNGLGVFQYSYNGASSQIKQIDYPNAQKTLFDYYDPNGSSRLKEIINQGPSQEILSQFTYHYDFGGNIVQWDRQLSDAPQVYNFDYDKSDQLKSAVLKDPNTQTALKKSSYNYDAMGNRASEQEDHNSVAGGFNDLNQINHLKTGGSILFQGEVNEPALVKVNNQPAKTIGNQFEKSVKVHLGTNSITITAKDAQNNIRTNGYQVLVTNEINTVFVYDLDGNLIMASNQQSVVTYQWDAFNRLTQINQPSRVTELGYDGLGRWVKISETENNILTSDKRFLWVGNAVVEERKANNEITKRFYGSGVQFVDQNKNYYYTRDHLGSIREVTDENGIVQARYDYNPWGEREKIAGNFEANFGFTGHYFHQPSGLHLTRYRAYDANHGRWLSRDPIGELGGINLYSYVLNDPINLWDPLGLLTWGPRVNVSLVFVSFTLSLVSDDKGGREYQSTFSLGFTPGISITGGVSITSANYALCLRGAGNSAGISGGGAPFTQELNYLWGDGYWGVDYGFGFGGSPLRVAPQYFRGETVFGGNL